MEHFVIELLVSFYILLLSFYSATRSTVQLVAARSLVLCTGMCGSCVGHCLSKAL